MIVVTVQVNQDIEGLEISTQLEEAIIDGIPDAQKALRVVQHLREQLTIALGAKQNLDLGQSYNLVQQQTKPIH